MQGKRPRERPRIGMLNELKEGSYGQMKRTAEDREGWRCWIHETCHLTEHYRRMLSPAMCMSQYCVDSKYANINLRNVHKNKRTTSCSYEDKYF